MSKHTPFEEMDERWSDLPLPDADAAWRDMDVLLDQEEKKRSIPPILPAFLSGCAGWSLLLLVVAAGAFGIYRYQATHNGQSAPVPTTHTEATPENTDPTKSSPQNQYPPAGNAGSHPETDPNAVATIPGRQSFNDSDPDRQSHGAGDPGLDTSDRNTDHPGATATKPPATRRSTATQGQAGMPAAIAKTASAPTRATIPAARKHGGGNDVARISTTPLPGMPAQPRSTTGKTKGAAATGKEITDKDNPVASTQTPVAGNSDTVAQVTQTNLNQPKPLYKGTTLGAEEIKRLDSAGKAARTTAQLAADSAAATAAIVPPKKPSRRAWSFSAGVGISQALPVSGQQGGSENYKGKVNPLTEHVPSGWLRAHKGRWYLQGEVRFNAPQLISAFVFTQKTGYDTSAHAVQTVRQQLRKAWYHQFPLTVNYHVQPHWTIGAGAQYSLLYRAAGVRTTVRRSITSTQWQESSVPFQVPGYRDSFLYKSQWQLVLQTEFEWRRWGIGLRYRSDLEPFLRYTKPDGTVTDVSNEAFEATLRFRLWQSKRRK